MKPVLIVIFVIFSATQILGQRGPSGPASIQVEDAALPNLEQLVNASSLIVAGTVSANLGTEVAVPGEVFTLTTNSLILIDKVYKGKVPGGRNQIAVSQIGGKGQGLELRVPQAPLMQAGEHYMLFLSGAAAKRADPTEARDGLPLFHVVGISSGLLKIMDGNIIVPSGSRSTRLYNDWDHKSQDAFLKTLQTLVIGDVKGVRRSGLPAEGGQKTVVPFEGGCTIVLRGTGPPDGPSRGIYTLGKDEIPQECAKNLGAASSEKNTNTEK